MKEVGLIELKFQQGVSFRELGIESRREAIPLIRYDSVE